MVRISWIIILFVFGIGCYSSKPAPKEYENCITSGKDDDFLIIKIRTKNNPSKYSLEIGQVYFDTTNIKDNRRLSPTYWSAKVNDGIFIIEIDVKLVNELMQDKDFVISVLLYNLESGREELYLREV
jgi:hypothetical protein